MKDLKLCELLCVGVLVCWGLGVLGCWSVGLLVCSCVRDASVAKSLFVQLGC